MEKIMVLSRKILFSAAILMLCTVFLAGCSEMEGLGLDNGTVMTEPSDVSGEKRSGQESSTNAQAGGANVQEGGISVQEGNTGQGETGQVSEDGEVVTFSGIIKAIDEEAGTVTIKNEVDGELVLEVNDKSKILEGESQITLSDLADNIGSVVVAEYDNRTKMLTITCAQD